MALIDQVRDYKVRPKSFALWFLGQNSWILKSPSGFTIAIDPFLTDSLKGRRPTLDQSRQVPIFIEPEALKVDLFLCTHSHLDHADPGTIRGAVKAGTKNYMGPAEAVAVFTGSGVPEEQCILTWANDVKTFADLKLTGTFALPTDHTDLNHMGFVIEVGGGPKLYVTGDTAVTDLLNTAARHKPDVMIVCINGGFKNLSHWQAAELVKAVNPKLAIPCHYDMFKDNSCSPNMFRASLAIQGIEEKYRELAYATPFLYPEN